MSKRSFRWGLIVPLTMLMLIPGSMTNAQVPCEQISVGIKGGLVIDAGGVTIDFVENGAAHYTIDALGVAVGHGGASLKELVTDEPEMHLKLDPGVAVDPGVVGSFGFATGTAESKLGSGLFVLEYQNTNNRDGNCLGQAGLLEVVLV